jgi:hypothetical protein
MHDPYVGSLINLQLCPQDVSQSAGTTLNEVKVTSLNLSSPPLIRTCQNNNNNNNLQLYSEIEQN